MLFLLPIPFNLQGFDHGIFGEPYMENRKRILTTAVRMPFAHDVPRDVQPVPDAFASDAVTIGFLLHAEANGQLDPSTVELTPEVVNEFKVRLGVAQRRVDGRAHRLPATWRARSISPPAQGDVLHITSPIAITTVEDGQPTSRPVLFNPQLNGTELHHRAARPPAAAHRPRRRRHDHAVRPAIGLNARSEAFSGTRMMRRHALRHGAGAERARARGHRHGADDVLGRTPERRA